MLNLGIGFLLGIFLGSLIDCIANRSVTDESFWGRSYCPKCQKTLRWFDLFPILSYLFLKGKCRFCHKKIPTEHLYLELLTGLLIALLFYLNFDFQIFSLSPLLIFLKLGELIFQVFAVCILVSVIITDIKTGLIPDRITYPAIIISLVYLISASVLKVYLQYLSLTASPLGKYLLPPQSDYFQRHALISIYPSLWALGAAFIIGLFFFLLIIATRGRGMGGGDMKLGVFIGLTLGLSNSLVALMLAFLTGSLFGIALLLLGKKKLGQTIPFGPFLSLGSIIALFWGEKIANWYLNFSQFSLF